MVCCAVVADQSCRMSSTAIPTTPQRNWADSRQMNSQLQLRTQRLLRAGLAGIRRVCVPQYQVPTCSTILSAESTSCHSVAYIYATQIPHLPNRSPVHPPTDHKSRFRAHSAHPVHAPTLVFKVCFISILRLIAVVYMRRVEHRHHRTVHSAAAAYHFHHPFCRTDYPWIR